MAVIVMGVAAVVASKLEGTAAGRLAHATVQRQAMPPRVQPDHAPSVVLSGAALRHLISPLAGAGAARSAGEATSDNHTLWFSLLESPHIGTTPRAALLRDAAGGVRACRERRRVP